MAEALANALPLSLLTLIKSPVIIRGKPRVQWSKFGENLWANKQEGKQMQHRRCYERV
eukprot:SAG11_NODE_4288_length_1968_cov_1.046014_1_plen_57_part_10